MPKKAEIDFWNDIWLKPVATVQWVYKSNPDTKFVYLFLYVLGVTFGLSSIGENVLFQNLSLTQILLLSFSFSGLGGLLTYHLYIFALSISSKWLGGNSNFQGTRLAFSFSAFPSLLVLAVLLIQLLLFGKRALSMDPLINPSTEGEMIFFGILTVLVFLLSIYQLFLFVILLAKIQSFNIFKSILSYLIALFLVFTPFIAIGMIASWLY